MKTIKTYSNNRNPIREILPGTDCIKYKAKSGRGVSRGSNFTISQISNFATVFDLSCIDVDSEK